MLYFYADADDFANRYDPNTPIGLTDNTLDFTPAGVIGKVKPPKVDYDNISTVKPGQVVKPRDLNEQIFILEVRSNPAAGKDLELSGDPRFPREEGWTKRAQAHELPDGTKIDVHYQYNTNTGQVVDVKIDTPKRSEYQLIQTTIKDEK